MTNSNDKILIIGAKGLVGKYFCESSKYKGRIVEVTSSTKIEDVNFEQISSVVFLAQSSEYKLPVYSDNLLYVNNILLHKALLASAGSRKQFIYFSTGSVYVNNSEELTENSPLNTLSPNAYVASKISGELMVRSFIKEFQSITIVRPFFVYGKGQQSGMLISAMASNVINKTPIKLNSKNGLIFNPVHASDLVSFLDLMITEKSEGLTTYNVAGPEVVSLKEIISTIESITNIKANVEVQDSPDNALLAKVNVPNWKPEIGMVKGLTEFLSDEK